MIRPRQGFFEATRHEAYDAATHAEQDRARSFSRFFTEHLCLPADHPQREYLRERIEEWCIEIANGEPLYNNLVTDALALIEQIESLAACTKPLEKQIIRLADHLEISRINKGDVTLTQVKTLYEKFEDFSRKRNGLVAFHDRLQNRFGGFVDSNEWIEENLGWRKTQMGLGIDRESFNKLAKTVLDVMDKIKSKAPPATPSAPPTTTSYLAEGEIRKVQGHYPREMRNDVDRQARERARNTKPIPGLGSFLVDSYKGDSKDHRWSGDMVRPWRHGKPLDEDDGCINAFIRTDANDMVVDRIVEKTNVYRDQWNKRSYWIGRSPGMTESSNYADLMPAEWYTQAMLSSRADSRFFLGVRSWPRISIRHKMMRMYVEYCGGGDLHDLIVAYNDVRYWVPDTFVWMVFKALAEAALVMKSGSTIAKLEDWNEIVHRDLKLANVFLDEPDFTHYPKYPRAKVADFGHAIITTEDDPLNPILYNQSEGTQGFLPPEQIQFVVDETGEPVHDFKLLSHTNVWGIGAVMRSLMHASYDEDDTENYETMGIDGTSTWPPFAPYVVDYYGEWLCDKVEQCLMVNPAERPTVEQLVAELEEQTQRSEELRGVEEGDEKHEPDDLLGWKEDEYKIGMVIPPRELEADESWEAAFGDFISADEERAGRETVQEQREYARRARLRAFADDDEEDE